MDRVKIDKRTSVGEEFLQALSSRDFETLQTLFDDALRFRALVPKGIREANAPVGAVAWYQRWFEEADYFELSRSALDKVADRLCIDYRIFLHDADGWQVIEQKTFCILHEGRIQDMWLVCSGFCPDAEPTQLLSATEGLSCALPSLEDRTAQM